MTDSNKTARLVSRFGRNRILSASIVRTHDDRSKDARLRARAKHAMRVWSEA